MWDEEPKVRKVLKFACLYFAHLGYPDVGGIGRLRAGTGADWAGWGAHGGPRLSSNARHGHRGSQGGGRGDAMRRVAAVSGVGVSVPHPAGGGARRPPPPPRGGPRRGPGPPPPRGGHPPGVAPRRATPERGGAPGLDRATRRIVWTPRELLRHTRMRRTGRAEARGSSLGFDALILRHYTSVGRGRRRVSLPTGATLRVYWGRKSGHRSSHGVNAHGQHEETPLADTSGVEMGGWRHDDSRRSPVVVQRLDHDDVGMASS